MKCKWLVGAILFELLAIRSSSQQLALSGRVEDESGKTIAGVTVRVMGMGQDTSKPTTGEFSIPLKASVRPGQEVEVSIIPGQWVLKNHYAGRVVVPEMAGVHLVIVKKGSFSLLSDDRIRQLMQEATRRVGGTINSDEGTAK
jgi:hypothetical protein